MTRAGTYGIAVSLLMAITTLLAALMAIQWGYPPAIVIAVNGFFFAIDCIFFSANSVKFLEGGWFPLVLAGADNSASSATMPPSPRLSARRISSASFSEMIRIAAHRISDTTPSTADGVSGPPWVAAFAASFRAWSGLVPMSP
jgi:hypothetical protein